MSNTSKSTPNYWDYLELKPLLGLQGGLEKDETQLHTDELHFIVTHQALELWFKLILAESEMLEMPFPLLKYLKKRFQTWCITWDA